MNGEQRREKIIDILNSSSKPVSGVALASMLNVSRQVIVQDIALIRALIMKYHQLTGICYP